MAEDKWIMNGLEWDDPQQDPWIWRESIARSLQSRSPSCGVKQRYDGTFAGTLVDGAGVTAQLLMDNGFRCLAVEEL